MEILKILSELNSTNSNLEKQTILKKYKNNAHFKKVLIYTYDTTKQYHITSKTVKKFKKEKLDKYTDAFVLLDDLNDKKITGHDALKYTLGFLNSVSDEEKDLFSLIIERNLKIRMNISSINKVYDTELIHTFEPVLSQKYEPKIELNEDWYISRKLDGVRCLIHVQNNKATAFSRNGKPLYHLDSILSEIPKMKENVFLDGELIYIENNLENFTKTIEIVRKSVSKTNTDKLFYKIFDIIPEKEFLNKKGKSTFLKRQHKLDKIFENNKKILIVKQTKYSEKALITMSKQVSDLGWEGLMIRKDVSYKGKRTNDLLKIKKFHDEEFEVIDTTNDNIRSINKKTGLEETNLCLSSITINVGGVECKVGSGFTMKQRKIFFDNPENILKKKVSIKYFEKTDDGSLRFPIFLSIRDYE